MADNFHFDMTGVPLDLALQVAFTHNKAVKGFTSNPGRLTLYHTTTDLPDVTVLPAPMTYDEVMPMIKAWQKTAVYGPQPDHDGDNGKGLRVFNEAWSHVDGRWQAFVAFEPVWLEYGK